MADAPDSVKKNLESLVNYLASDVQDEFELIRGIYKWICDNIDYDINTSIEFEIEPETVLKTGKSVCGGYASLCEELVLKANLKQEIELEYNPDQDEEKDKHLGDIEIATVEGYGKGWGYQLCDDFDGPPNHAWNAIKIRGKWYLIDCTWGAGFVDLQGNYIRRFDDHYFLTDPEEFIYGHFPVDLKWQLLDKPLTMEQFIALPYIKSQFFKMGLQFDNNAACGYIITDQSMIRLKAPEVVIMSANFILIRDLKSDPYINLEYERNVFIQHNNKYLEILLAPPQTGGHLLTLFTALAPNLSGWMLETANFKIFNQGSGEETAAFPEIYSGFRDYKAYLFSPYSYELTSSSTYLFKLKIPRAAKAAVVINDNLYPLVKNGDIFENDIRIINPGEIAVVAAKSESSTHYDWLLQYFAK